MSVVFQKPRGGNQNETVFQEHRKERLWKHSWEVKTREIREGRRQVGLREWVSEGSGLERLIGLKD